MRRVELLLGRLGITLPVVHPRYTMDVHYPGYTAPGGSRDVHYPGYTPSRC